MNFNEILQDINRDGSRGKDYSLASLACVQSHLQPLISCMIFEQISEFNKCLFPKTKTEVILSFPLENPLEL